eukprot:484425-Rhodomonas_salina.1
MALLFHQQELRKENEIACQVGAQRSWKARSRCKDTEILAVPFEEKKCKRIVVAVMVGPHVVVCEDSAVAVVQQGINRPVKVLSTKTDERFR